MAPIVNVNQSQSRKRPNDGLVDPSLGRLQKAVKTVTIARILAAKAQLTSDKNKTPTPGIPPTRVPVEIPSQVVDHTPSSNLHAAEEEGPKSSIVIILQPQEQTTANIGSSGAATTSSKNDTKKTSHQSTKNKANAITPEKQSPTIPVPSLASVDVIAVSSKLPNHATNGASSMEDSPPSAKPGRHEKVRDAPSNEEVQLSEQRQTLLSQSLPKPIALLSPNISTMTPRQCGLISENEGENESLYSDYANKTNSTMSTGPCTSSHFDRAIRFVQFFVPILYLITSARSVVVSIQRSALANGVLASNTPTTTMPQSGTILTLRDILSDHDTGFHLAMAPAFFGFYGYFGALAAWYEVEPSLPIQSIAGASAGAMAAVLMGAGIAPKVAADFCSDMTLSRFADFPGFGAVFRGNRWESLMDEFLSSATNRTGTSWKLQEAIVPVAVTAFDLQTFQGKILTHGSMARAARASATFPLLFQPVGWIDDSVPLNDYIFIDGGIGDPNGLVGLTKTLPFSNCRRVVNLSIGPFVAARIPFDTEAIELISISITGLPQPSPLAMAKGPKAYAAAQEAMRKALDVPLLRRGNAFELTIASSSR